MNAESGKILKFKGTPKDVPYALLQNGLSRYAKTLSESGFPPTDILRNARHFMRLSALLIAVAASAMLAVAGVAHMDPVQLAVHAVLVKTAFGDPAGNPSVDLMFHIALLLPYYAPFPEFYRKRLTNPRRSVTIFQKEKIMKVILKADVKGSGKKDDIIEVSDGYAKNFLLKKGLAEVATSSGVNEIRQKKNSDAFHKAENLKAQRELAAKLNGLTVPVSIRAGENGKVFGSVTTEKIASVLGELGFEVDKKRIVTKEPLKNVGEYDAEVKFSEGVTAKIKIVVSPL